MATFTVTYQETYDRAELFSGETDLHTITSVNQFWCKNINEARKKAKRQAELYGHKVLKIRKGCKP